MEENHKSNKIVNDILCLLPIMAELHAPINYYHYDLLKGLCILIEDPDDADHLLYTLNNLKDIQIMKSPRIKHSNLPNFKFALYSMQKNDSPDTLKDFLTTSRFLTAVIVSGAVPNHMPDTHIIVIPKSPVAHHDTELLNSEISAVKNFLRDNPYTMEEELEKFSTSVEYMEHPGMSPLYMQMHIAARMYQLWYRNCHCESETRNRYFNLLHSIENISKASENYIDNVELSDIFVELFLNYAEKHRELHFIHINAATDKACDLMRKNGNIIFHDDLYYYLTENIFKIISQPLLKSFQLTYIKENLRISGILCSNNCQNNNFTRKKILFTESGIDSRNRFLWLDKKFFESWDKLSPEERETTNEKHVLGKNRPQRLLDVKQRT